MALMETPDFQGRKRRNSTKITNPKKKNIGHNPSPVVMIFPIYINGFGYTAQQIWVPNDPHV
jgi:hypothetical protein